MTSMQGKVCLVTGATSGIGLVTARELAWRGARVVLVGRNRTRTDAAMSWQPSLSGSARKVRFFEPRPNVAKFALI